MKKQVNQNTKRISIKVTKTIEPKRKTVKNITNSFKKECSEVEASSARKANKS